jgi:hypothetical protein
VVVLCLCDPDPGHEEGVFVALVVVMLCLCDLEPDREKGVFVALPVVDIPGRNILPLEARHSWFQVDVRSCSHPDGDTCLCAVDSSVLWCIFGLM